MMLICQVRLRSLAYQSGELGLAPVAVKMIG
jgi:hypothetical protein